MTQEDKQLLLKDLCARLPYGVKILYEGWDSDHGCDYELVQDFVGMDDSFIYTTWRGERKKHSVNYMKSIKPYLRPMSSMTDEEISEFQKRLKIIQDDEQTLHFCNTVESIDWLNAHHFDYRGLIEKGLALEAPEGMYEIG